MFVSCERPGLSSLWIEFGFCNVHRVSHKIAQERFRHFLSRVYNSWTTGTRVPSLQTNPVFGTSVRWLRKRFSGGSISLNPSAGDFWTAGNTYSITLDRIGFGQLLANKQTKKQNKKNKQTKKYCGAFIKLFTSVLLNSERLRLPFLRIESGSLNIEQVNEQTNKQSLGNFGILYLSAYEPWMAGSTTSSKWIWCIDLERVNQTNTQ